MRGHRGVVAVVCIGAALGSAHLTQAQEAASANLPDQFQTREMALTSKSKKKKAESNAQTVATAPKQNNAPSPEQTPAVEEPPPPILPADEKKAEPSTRSVSSPPFQKPPSVTEQPSPAETSVVAVAPVEKKPRLKKRPRPAVQPETASIEAPVPMSLSVAQSMAISAPLPQYSYEAKRRNLVGSGVCVISVDPATGRVTDATMFQSTGSAILDKLTTQTFKSWRFKPGTVSQVRLPISYE